MTKKIKSRKIVKYYYYEEERDHKKIAYLLFLLLITSMLLSTSSYAWFTTNRVVSINTLNVKVQAEGSLEISVDGINWRAGIGKDEIIAASATYPGSINQLPSLIVPVSTDGMLSDDGLLDMYSGKIASNDNGDYILVSYKSEEYESSGDDSTGEFIAFDVFLKINESKELYLTGDSLITYNGEISIGTENAMRAAFVVEGNTVAGDSIANIQGLRTVDDNNVYIWEPNYDTHTRNGVSNARDVYGITTSMTNASRIVYDGVSSEITEDDNILLGNARASLYPNKFKTVEPKIMTTAYNGVPQSLFTLNSGVTKLRIYLWLEGQDVDCENNASLGNLSINLKFSTNPM